MKIGIIASEKVREEAWAAALSRGVKAMGDEVASDAETEAGEIDAVAFIGVKHKRTYDFYRQLGVSTLLFDKGYNRVKRASAPLYWRVAINAHSCTADLDMNAPHDRVHTLDVELKPWRKEGDHIVYAGSSAKYHEFVDLPPPEEYVHKICRRLSKLTDRMVYYRPKPSYRAAEPVDSAVFSRGGRIGEALKGVHAVVTHGSNACFDAVCAGVPCIVLGDGVAKPISSTEVEDIENPYLASEDERLRWLAALSYWQWTNEELASGEAWEHIRAHL